VVNVARLSPQKNHRVLLEATRLVYEKDKSIRLLLVGTGRLRDEVKHLIDYFGLGEMCAMTSGRRDIPRLLLASNVFFFPSLWEGLPGAALEAFAAGLPVVASDIPPLREIAPFFPASVFIASSDDVAKHAEHLRLALEMPIDRMIAQARFAASPFTLESSVEAYRSLYGVQ
jgi:glycosyltransferase involved in cell wall biosynthesis